MTDRELPPAEEVLYRFAQEVKKIAFEMPAPNVYTPRLVMLAIAADRAYFAIREAALANPSEPSSESAQPCE
jgi:hypothetical protein